METNKHTNRLIHSSSPYLLQHAHNPVNWYEWGDEAFAKAKAEDKLVLVSIGYSACHWCHVMEHECFEKEDTAALMNEHFVCIKVDREERPDVDQVYMDAVQLLTGRGGWPLNCFTLPDGRPLHGGTYFPKQDWEKVLRSLADFYSKNKEEALKYATELTQGVQRLNIIEKAEGDFLLLSQVDELIKNRKPDFDTQLGGFAWAPKFPMPVHWELFLQQYHYSKDEDLLNAVNTTLTKMAEGGIYDQVAGGFSRYSVDVFWKVPHFEKMLYDNAQLVSVYCQAYQLTKNKLYRKTVLHTLDFVCNELTAPEGVFYSALDADSEGVEGKFYVWHKKELQEILGADEPLYSLYYSVDAYGNWEHENNILYKTRTNEELEQLTGKSIADIEHVIEQCNRQLLEQRKQRVRPGLDDKTITSWNALMIKAYADAYLTFGDQAYLQQAVKAADFILEKMWDGEMLYRIYKEGKVSINGFAEDYALLCEALTRLYEASGEEKYVLAAKQMLDACITRFYDPAAEAFYFKSRTDAQLVSSKIDFNDDVIPSSNSVLAKSLYVLGYLFDEPSYHTIADDLLKNVSKRLERNPGGFSNWLQVMLMKHHGLHQFVLAGKGAKEQIVGLSANYVPHKVLALAANGTNIPLLKEKQVNGELTFYVCHDKTCSLPLHSLEEVRKAL